MALCNRTSGFLCKLFAPIASFLCIFIWHIPTFANLIWILSNYIVFNLEQFRRFIVSIDACKRRLKYIGTNNKYRLKALFGCQLLIISCLGNAFFLADNSIGMEYIAQTFLINGFKNYIILTAVCYCWYISCEFRFPWEAAKKGKKQTKTE